MTLSTALVLMVCVSALWTGPAAQPALAQLEGASAASQPLEAHGPATQTQPVVPLTEQVSTFADLLRLPYFWRANPWTSWLLLLLAMLFGLLLGRIAAAILLYLGHRWRRQGQPIRGELIAAFASPASLAIFTFLLSIGLEPLAMAEALRHFLRQCLALLYTIAIFWSIYNLTSLTGFALQRLGPRTYSYLDERLVPILRRILRVFLLVIATLFVMQNFFGANIGAWLAGLGIVGLAISLAAQDSLKNLFGSITILFDRPFGVGDHIIYEKIDGIVEEVGFRSTRVRTFFGHLVTIPNASIVNTPIENITARGYIRRDLNLSIPADIAPETLERCLQAIQNLLARDGIREAIAGPGPYPSGYQPPRVYFSDYKGDRLNLLVIYWYRPADWWGYLEHAERVNLALFRALAELGIKLRPAS